jgi:hypothetical protein
LRTVSVSGLEVFGARHDASAGAAAHDRRMSQPQRLLTPAFALVLAASLAYFLARTVRSRRPSS